jgi:hypothetical protein
VIPGREASCPSSRAAASARPQEAISRVGRASLTLADEMLSPARGAPRAAQKISFAGRSLVEPGGIEPATSCLQRAGSCSRCGSNCVLVLVFGLRRSLQDPFAGSEPSASCWADREDARSPRSWLQAQRRRARRVPPVRRREVAEFDLIMANALKSLRGQGRCGSGVWTSGRICVPELMLGEGTSITTASCHLGLRGAPYPLHSAIVSWMPTRRCSRSRGIWSSHPPRGSSGS